MGTPWRPEREIGSVQARAAVATSGYDGPLDSVEVVAAGWDNTVVLVDGSWIFRFPRRGFALPGIRREIEWLPRLAPHLPVPTPVPCWTGITGEPPWPFWGARHLPGDELARRPEVDRGPVAAIVGSFLRTLHALPQAVLPVDPLGRADSAARAPRARDVLSQLEALGRWHRDPRIDRLLDAGGALGPPTGDVVLSHGDLYSRHVLVDDDGAVSGIIDWGDMCLASPAVDLAIAYSAFDGDSRAVLLEAYGPVEPETLLRAQVFAVMSAASVAHYAHDIDDSVLLTEAITGLAGIAS